MALHHQTGVDVVWDQKAYMHKTLCVLAILGLTLTPACFCATPPPAGQTNCKGVLVDTQTDPLNCGVCGNPCLTGQKCSAGLCTVGGSGGSCGSCTAGQVCCGGTCYTADPTVGCADGTREGFSDTGAFPAIAACAATWSAQSMQSPRTCQPCGNGLGACAAPEDACAFGWHLCMKNGAPNDLTTRVTMAQCNSALGGAASFVTGTSIFPSSANASNCGASTCTLPLPCTSGNWGASGLGYAPYCCGTGCMSDGCANCIYGTGSDYWAGNNEGCAQYASTDNDGVLCCKDPAVQ